MGIPFLRAQAVHSFELKFRLLLDFVFQFFLVGEIFWQLRRSSFCDLARPQQRRRRQHNNNDDVNNNNDDVNNNNNNDDVNNNDDDVNNNNHDDTFNDRDAVVKFSLAALTKTSAHVDRQIYVKRLEAPAIA